MFANSDTFYLYFGVVFLVLGIGIFGGLSYVILTSSLEQSLKYEKVVELTKWYFGSLALVIGAAIVANSFQERQQDVQEFAVFDKYVSTILDAQGIEKRLLLADYFALVAPSGELRDSWTRYRDFIKPTVDQLVVKNEELAVLVQAPEKTKEDLKRIAVLQSETAKFKESLAEASGDQRKWTIVAGTDVSLSEAQFELQKALGLNSSAQIYKVNNKFVTTIPGFRTFSEASDFLPTVWRVVNSTAYVADIGSLCKTPSVEKGFTDCTVQPKAPAAPVGSKDSEADTSR